MQPTHTVQIVDSVVIVVVDLPKALNGIGKIEIDVQLAAVCIVSDAPEAKFQLVIPFEVEVLHNDAQAKFSRKRHQLTVRVPCNDALATLHVASSVVANLKQADAVPVEGPTLPPNTSAEALGAVATEKEKGDSLERRGELKEAGLCWQAALVLCGSNSTPGITKIKVDLLVSLCEVDLECADLCAAEEKAQRALSLAGTNSRAHHYLYCALQRQQKWFPALAAAKRALATSEDDDTRHLECVVQQAFNDAMYQDHVLQLKCRVRVRAYPGKGNGVEASGTGYSVGSLIFNEPVIAAGAYSSSIGVCSHCFTVTSSASINCAHCGDTRWCSRQCQSKHAAHKHLCRGYCFDEETKVDATSRHAALKTAADRGHGIWVAAQVLAQMAATGHAQEAWFTSFGAMASGKWSVQDGDAMRHKRLQVLTSTSAVLKQCFAFQITQDESLAALLASKQVDKLLGIINLNSGRAGPVGVPQQDCDLWFVSKLHAAVNHSCLQQKRHAGLDPNGPNAKMAFSHDLGCFSVRCVAVREIGIGEEITICYATGDISRAAGDSSLHAYLKRTRNFDCMCANRACY
jgi:hypothetical protein